MFDREKLIYSNHFWWLYIFCLPPYLAIRKKTSGLTKDFELTRLTVHVIMHEGYSIANRLFKHDVKKS